MVDFQTEDLVRVGISVLCGSIIGLEREYKNKAAGFRTLILICLGSTIFTIVSQKATGESDDRIAANIITGIGFIGAGVIFKDGLAVRGLTTAAVIWVVAALGMVIGMFDFSLSLALTIVVLLVLSVLSKVEQWIDVYHYEKTFKITFATDSLSNLRDLERLVESKGLKSKCSQFNKHHGKLHTLLQVSGPRKKVQAFSLEMVEMASVEDILMS
ncbi:MgtC/SapB family protein [Pedobacter sp. SYSU D00535]|uniref:MgtC/SapB family protein n=1 Tax=Pedobacter sp. SYSU D00535 TaxID=2810308 RepID=UPI001A97C4AB|nr:MgtC/SapB family protein [Pedobacter sp. SYSU D00535]